MPPHAPGWVWVLRGSIASPDLAKTSFPQSSVVRVSPGRSGKNRERALANDRGKRIELFPTVKDIQILGDAEHWEGSYRGCIHCPSHRRSVCVEQKL